MRRKRRVGILIGALLGAFAAVLSSAAANEPSIGVTPDVGLCSTDVEIRGTGFTPGDDIRLLGLFDLVETTQIGIVGADAAGRFVLQVPRNALPADCWQGRELLFAAEPADDTSGTSRVTASYLVGGPWQLKLQPTISDCSAAIEVSGSGFSAEQGILLALGPVHQFVEFDFAVVAEALTDADGEFRAEVNIERLCSEDSERGVYAWPVTGTGERAAPGWARAILSLLASSSEPTPSASGSPTATPTPSATPLADTEQPTEVAGDAAGDDRSSSGRSAPALNTGVVVLLLLLSLVAAVGYRLSRRG